MWIKDLWDRVLAKFKKEEDIPEPEPVMELRPEKAPEPVPERKTSDEMIIEMAESVSRDGSETEKAPDETVRAAEREVHEDTDPADVTEESEVPGNAEAAAWEIHEDTDPADVTEESEVPGNAEAAAWEIHEDTDPADGEAEKNAGED